MILQPTLVSTERFTYVPAENMFVTEASDLGLGHGIDFGRVYDDACDVGLTLVSHRTGTRVVFAIEHEERRDGDLLYWDLRPADRSKWGCGTVRIFND